MADSFITLASGKNLATFEKGIVHLQRILEEEPWAIRVARGLVDGYSLREPRGRNAAVVGVETAIWEPGGAYNWLVAADLMKVASSDANDTAAGTGARTVEITGLSATWGEQTVTVILNGVTPVLTAVQFLRVNSVKVLTAGSGGKNAGAITVKNQADVLVGQIAIGDNVAAQANFTVPIGRTAHVVRVQANATVTDRTRIRLMAREPNAVFRPVADFEIAGTTYEQMAPGAVSLPAMTDIVLTGIRLAGAASVVVSGAYALALATP